MKRLLRLRSLVLVFAALAGAAWGQPPWRELPPEDRRQMREQMREHWQQERGPRGEGPPPAWRDLAPEERQRLREEMRQQHREIRREHHRSRRDG